MQRTTRQVQANQQLIMQPIASKVPVWDLLLHQIQELLQNFLTIPSAFCPDFVLSLKVQEVKLWNTCVKASKRRRCHFLLSI